MTPEQIEFHRKRFENWFIGDLDVNLKRDAAGKYTFMNAHAAWNAWISAIESIEIDQQYIPMSCCINSSYKKGFDDCNDRFVESIKSLGLKFKE